MCFFAVDDETYMLKEIEEMLRRVRPNDEIFTFSNPAKALEAAKRQPADVAFLDIQMGSMTGLELALELKKLQPDMHIIFVTGYQEYAVQAFQMHATGYLLKPIVEEDLIRELTFIYGEKEKKRIRVQTFGGFDLFVDEKLIKFERAKAKELLAYLIDRKGSGATTAQAYSALFENAADTSSGKTYFRNIVHSLKNTLKNAGAEEILLRDFNRLAVVPQSIDCDYYRFLDGDPIALNHFRDDYMPQYSWAEVKNADLHFTNTIFPE